ncbi:hypothetical protein T492DRAFT_837500 [Pavlovales sp. CCMP2436]|nr:hypothetical protein T492DRAFT_837500 [Pavlovales sp. CCMP2436]
MVAPGGYPQPVGFSNSTAPLAGQVVGAFVRSRQPTFPSLADGGSAGERDGGGETWAIKVAQKNVGGGGGVELFGGEYYDMGEGGDAEAANLKVEAAAAAATAAAATLKLANGSSGRSTGKSSRKNSPGAIEAAAAATAAAAALEFDDWAPEDAQPALPHPPALGA